MNYEEWKKEQIEFDKQSIEWADRQILVTVERWDRWQRTADANKDSRMYESYKLWAAQELEQLAWLQKQKRFYENQYKLHTEDGE